MSEIGKPVLFDPEVLCNLVEMLIQSDEVDRALRLLADGAPSYYRENPTERMLEMRESLHRQLFTPSQYHAADLEARGLGEDQLAQYWPARAQVLAERIKMLNDKGVKPNLMEIGPGSFWLPYALRFRGYEFTYEFQSLDNSRALPFDKPPEIPGVNIFCAFELIEHLANEFEIYQAYLKFKKDADFVFLSTPRHTFNGGMEDWRNNYLGHLRCYSPKEFLNVASSMFLDRNWEIYGADDTTVLVGHTIKE